ncbi:MAG: DUF1700 domain-containing protein, partial [Eggerthellaceae bacterium]|nr:DUF1700 domain-containing protein [Eggerthellaceae bacterium]
MNKTEFLAQLSAALTKLPQYEIDQSLAFYAEMIDDRIEEGSDETEAVATLGYIADIAAQIIAEVPIVPKTIAKANTGSRSLNIVLLVAFSWFWVPLCIVFAAAVLCIYAAIWVVIIAFWVVVISFFIAGLACFVSAVYMLATMHPATAILCVGVGLVCAGIGLFSYFG